MNRTELINAFAESIGMAKKEAAEILEHFLNVITNTLAKHEEIKLIGFGTFRVVRVKSKIVTNPQNKQKIEIQGYEKVRFIPGQTLKNKVNKK